MKRRHIGISMLLQTALIVAPLAVLSGVGFYFLREDKAAVERDARDRAAALLPELVRRTGGGVAGMLALATEPPPIYRGVIAGGIIKSPPDYPRVPEPPEWPGELSSEQTELWNQAQDAIFGGTGSSAAEPPAGKAQKGLPQLDRSLAALNSLASPASPPALRANAEYLRLFRIPRTALPAQAAALAKESRGIVSESGVPVSDLLLLAALRGAVPGLSAGVLNELTDCVRRYPSLLTPELLDAAGKISNGDNAKRIAALKAEWVNREQARDALRSLLNRGLSFSNPFEAWVDVAGKPYLALIGPQEDGAHVSLFSEPALGPAFLGALVAAGPRTLPAYAALSLQIAGKSLPLTRYPKPGIALASAFGTFNFDSPHTFALTLAANSDLLYAGYRRRLWLIAALILTAALTALLSVAHLWRSFLYMARLNQMKSNFVSSVSHELRAPIAAVRLMAESLDSGKIEDDAKKKDYFRLIVQECRRLSSLVENVLDFSRIDQGRKRYVFEPLDLLALVRHTVALMQPAAEEAGVALALAEDPADSAKLEPCWDHQAIEQSLVNLIDNAIKFSPRGAEVTARIETRDSAVRLWVEDRGPGVPQEAQAKIFDLFYRHGSELRRETKGAGIGLSIVKHVAEAHGGLALVESQPGQGSRFALDLPLYPPASVRKEAS